LHFFFPIIHPEGRATAPVLARCLLGASLQALPILKSGAYFEMIFIRRVWMSATQHTRNNGVRFRTEKSLFIMDVAFKFGAGVAATRALMTKNSKGACGLV
jgi:hypothetical protein